MVKISVKQYFEKPTDGFKVAEFEVCNRLRRTFGRPYQVVTHRDAITTPLPHGIGDVPVGNHQRAFRHPEDATDYFEFCCWRLQRDSGATFPTIRHTE